MAADVANLKNWQYHIDLEQIAWATLDVKGQAQNTLGRAAIEELDTILTAVADGVRAKSVRGLVVMSGKEKSFVAGADIKEFDNLKTEADVVEAVRAATEFSTASNACPSPLWLRSTASVSEAASNSHSPVTIAFATARK